MQPTASRAGLPLRVLRGDGGKTPDHFNQRCCIPGLQKNISRRATALRPCLSEAMNITPVEACTAACTTFCRSIGNGSDCSGCGRIDRRRFDRVHRCVIPVLCPRAPPATLTAASPRGRIALTRRRLKCLCIACRRRHFSLLEQSRRRGRSCAGARTGSPHMLLADADAAGRAGATLAAPGLPTNLPPGWSALWPGPAAAAHPLIRTRPLRSTPSRYKRCPPTELKGGHDVPRGLSATSARLRG